jgi:hypothetical protein
MAEARYWHGGIPGLRPGDLLLPASVTGTDRNLTGYGTPTGWDNDHVRTDRVHLTTHRAAAKAFAAMYPDGALYVAEPIGDTEPDPDAPEDAVRCESARVVSVYDPCVRWAERGHRWLRPLQAREA